MDDARRRAGGKDRGESKVEPAKPAAKRNRKRSRPLLRRSCGAPSAERQSRRAHRAAASPRAEIVRRAHRAHRAATLRRAEIVRRAVISRRAAIVRRAATSPRAGIARRAATLRRAEIVRRAAFAPRGGSAAGRRASGRRHGRQRPMGGNRPQRAPKGPELMPTVEKERVSNYDPNKKMRQRQHDPEHQPVKNRKQLARDTGYGMDDDVVRGRRKKGRQTLRAADDGPDQDRNGLHDRRDHHRPRPDRAHRQAGGRDHQEADAAGHHGDHQPGAGFRYRVAGRFRVRRDAGNEARQDRRGRALRRERGGQRGRTRSRVRRSSPSWATSTTAKRRCWTTSARRR